MLAALMRPEPQRSIDINDLHVSLGNVHDANAAETARQRKIKVTGYRNYCGGCGESKAIKAAVPKTTLVVAERPAERFFFDTTGPFPRSAGGSRYCLLVVDDATTVGWTLFMPDKSGSTLCRTIRSWHFKKRDIIERHGGWKIGRFDNRTEFVNTEVRELLVDLGVKPEFTPPDGAKRNGRVERKLALIAEGAKAAWLEFPHRFPDIEFPAKALDWHAVWAEAFSWMNDRINMTAQTQVKDKRCPWEKMYGKPPPFPLVPFMMPGNRTRKHAN